LSVAAQNEEFLIRGKVRPGSAIFPAQESRDAIRISSN
jgi:hypothetical protein